MRRSSRLLLLLSTVGTGSAPARADAPEFRADDVKGRLVRLSQGRLAPAALPPGVRRVAFYFGASWCGPCRAFVPELRAAYPLLRARDVEVVFFSDDADCRRMESYVAQARMPWPVVACRQRDQLAALRHARGAALPGLLVYDLAGTRMLTSWTKRGPSLPREALARLLASTP
jgi:nucleoredoxin